MITMVTKEIVSRTNPSTPILRVETIDARLGLPASSLCRSPGLPLTVEELGSTQQWRTLRLFVSSTFLDMQAERNLLHNFVLPQIQRLAR